MARTLSTNLKAYLIGIKDLKNRNIFVNRFLINSKENSLKDLRLINDDGYIKCGSCEDIINTFSSNVKRKNMKF